MLAKLLLILIGAFFLQCRSQGKQIRGTPEVDYPTYYIIPKTSFRCSDQLYNPGFYADTETRCQVFHYCYEHRQESFLCPMGTIFNQPILTCDYWYSSNCSLAPSYYHVNAVKKNDDFFDEVNEPLESQSENLFSKMAHLHEINNTSESPVLKNDSDASVKEGRHGIESSSEPLIEINAETEDYNKYSYDTHFKMVDEKHPEIVKYEVVGLHDVNVHEGSENEQLYETYNEKDFLLSADGMLHPNQEDIYQLYPTDMNFNQAYGGYAEIPSGKNLDDNLNGDYEGDFPILNSELQKRYSNLNVRRPLTRKSIIIAPEVQPEIVQLPILKHKRKPVGIPLMTSTIANDEYLYETVYGSNIHNEGTVSFENEDIKSSVSLDEPSSNFNYEFNDPKLFYKNLEQDNDENSSPLYQMENSQVIYDYSNKKKTRNMYVLSNTGEDDISSIFGSESNDLSSISNAEEQNTATDLNKTDKSETFIENSEDSTVFPSKSSDTAVTGSFDEDPFLGSGSEENIQSHLDDESSSSEDQDIISDTEDIGTTDSEISYELQMNLSDTFEGSGISAQETADMSNFAEEVNDNDSIEFILEDDSQDDNEHNRDSNFSLETLENFSPSENSQRAELVPEGSGRYNEFDYLPHESQESSDIHDASNKMVPEIQEIDGSYYYVYSDTEYQTNSEYGRSSEFYSENKDYAATEKFDGSSDNSPKEVVDYVRYEYVPVDSKLKAESPEKLSDEFEMEVSSEISEEYITHDSGNVRELSTEDLKFLEIMSQTPIPMPKNVFDVSYEKSNSDAVKDERPRIEIGSQAVNHEDTGGMQPTFELESLSSDTSLDIEEQSANSESSDINSEISEAEQKIIEDDLVTESSGQEELKILLPEQHLEALVPGKEIDPFNPLFAEGGEIFGNLESKEYAVIENFDDGSDSLPEELINHVKSHNVTEDSKLKMDNTKKLSESEQKSSLKINSFKPMSTLESKDTEKNFRKVERGKRSNENFRTFNPSSKSNPLITPSRETFREAVFSNIPTTFLKMKHSTLRPYFYNYNLRNAGFNPLEGDPSESSKLSKLTSLGKRLLAAKRSKFNTWGKIHRFLQI